MDSKNAENAVTPKEQPEALALCEQLATQNGWEFERQSEHELSIRASTEHWWCAYQLMLSWEENVSLQFWCEYEFKCKVPPARLVPLQSLIVLLNPRVWIGHFGYDEKYQSLGVRNAIVIRGTNGPTVEQIEDVVVSALNEAERYFPAFQFLIWGGRSPEEAIQAAMLETIGEA